MRLLYTIAFVLAFVSMRGQNILEMELLSHIEFNENGTDCWGFVDDNGIEYAVMGTRTATRIYSLEDPSNPIERYVVRGAPSVWRDIKYFNKHLYVTTDQGSDGLTIIDCSMAPDSFSFTRWQPELTVGTVTDTLRRAHNLFIDVPTGYCYIAGHNLSRRGVLLLDLNQDPKVPVLTSYVDRFYSHDAFVEGDRLYSSELGEGLAIYDISDKANPVELARRETSTDFCHNAWSTSDNNFVFTTDERSNAFLDSYDVSEDGTIKFLDKFRPLESIDWPTIPHNTHVLGNYAITSWYTDGIVITDMSRPDNIVMVGQYDTFTDEASLNPNSSWFSGCWGAYPYLPSGTVIASDINSGLYILGWKKVSAAYLEGTVTSKLPFELDKPITGVKVEILGTQLALDNTQTNGTYKTGRAEAGQVKVAFSHPNYNPDTLDAVLVNGEVTILDAQLTSNYLTVVVTDEQNNVIDDAAVVVLDKDTGNAIENTTDENGIAYSPVRFGGEYDVLVGKWGYLHNAVLQVQPNTTETRIEVVLKDGYQDDFFADLGWNVTSFADAGNWDRANPVGTFFNNTLSNTDKDVADDLGTQCFVTGNGGGGAGDDDVDNGITTLESPSIDMASWKAAKITYQTWFFNDGGQGGPNDTLIVYLSNGIDNYVIEKVTNSASRWSGVKTFEVTKDNIPFNDNMQLIITAGDYGQGHLVEAAFDNLLIEEKVVSSNDEITPLITWEMSPNPAQSTITISAAPIGARYNITNIMGSIIMTGSIDQKNTSCNISHLVSGSYIVSIIDDNGVSAKTLKVVR